jgi:hypothetical protein
MPVVKTPSPSSSAGETSAQSLSQSVDSAMPPRPPLRIINPYYVESKTDSGR